MLALPDRTKIKMKNLKTLPKEVLWQGRPSLVLALDRLGLTFMATVVLGGCWWAGIELKNWMFILYAVIAGYGLLRWLAKAVTILCIQYTITGERLLYKHGVFNRITDEIELFRVRDFQVREPISLRPWGLGNVVLITSDRTHPEIVIEAVPETAKLHSMVRGLVRQCWMNRGVYEVDAG